jgi:transposase
MPPEQLAAKVNTLERQNAELEMEVAQLRQQVDWFKRNLFGTGKSEKLDALQTRLGIDEAAPIETESVKQQVSYERKKAKKPRRSAEEQFEALPVVETVELVPAEVKAEPHRYKQIGEERTFEVDITPPKLFKRAIIRPKFKCLDDRDAPPLIEPALPRPAVCSYASAGLMAYVVWSKYLHHLPLYRQEKMSAHWGAQLSRKTMADWVAYVAEWFEPIYGRMRERLIAGDYIQADETPVSYIDPDVKKGKTSKGQLWLIGKPGSDVVFDWRLTRGHDEATSLLEGFEGALQSDGYGAYESFTQSNESVTRIACWAHVRRKFVEAEKESPQAVQLVLRLIGGLYAMERQWDANEWTRPKWRSALRKRDFAPVLSLLKRVVLKLRERSAPKLNLGKACGYLLGQWDALYAQLEHGQVRLDNNLIENAVRPSAIGKKNFLFIGSPEAGKRSAVIYSIIVSCERHGIDPLTYMQKVLGEMAKLGKNAKEVDHLIPSNWSPSGK